MKIINKKYDGYGKIVVLIENTKTKERATCCISPNIFIYDKKFEEVFGKAADDVADKAKKSISEKEFRDIGWQLNDNDFIANFWYWIF